MWSEQPIIGFDTETTGVDPLNERLVTCSLVHATGNGVTRRYWLADPGVDIPERATAVLGISTEKARQEGSPITDVLDEIAGELSTHLAAGYPVVAFNAAYDFTLIEAELARHDLATISERIGGPIFPVIDPYLLDRSVDRYRKGKRRLEDLSQHYGVAAEDDFHNAEADVVATLRVLGAMLRKYPKLVNTPLQEIVDMQVKANADFVAFLNRKAVENGRQPTESAEGWPVRS